MLTENQIIGITFPYKCICKHVAYKHNFKETGLFRNTTPHTVYVVVYMVRV